MKSKQKQRKQEGRWKRASQTCPKCKTRHPWQHACPPKPTPTPQAA